MNKPNRTFHYTLPTKCVHNFSLSRNTGNFFFGCLTRLLQCKCCMPHLVVYIASGDSGGDSGDDSGGDDSGDDSGGDGW